MQQYVNFWRGVCPTYSHHLWHYNTLRLHPLYKCWYTACQTSWTLPGLNLCQVWSRSQYMNSRSGIWPLNFTQMPTFSNNIHYWSRMRTWKPFMEQYVQPQGSASAMQQAGKHSKKKIANSWRKRRSYLRDGHERFKCYRGTDLIQFIYTNLCKDLGSFNNTLYLCVFLMTFHTIT